VTAVTVHILVLAGIREGRDCIQGRNLAIARPDALAANFSSCAAAAIAIASDGQPKSKNRTFIFMAGSSLLGCASSIHSLTHDQRTGAGHTILTKTIHLFTLAHN
jgi:hypothetical protein